MMGPLLVGSLLGPWIGHLSDTCRSRFGRRKPFILVGAWALCLSYGLVWMVPQAWPPAVQLCYFAIIGCVFYTAGAVYTVPLTSMVYELGDTPHKRTRLLGFTAYFFKTGSLLYQWVFPLAQLAIFGSVIVGIKFVGWGIGLFVFGLMGTLPVLFIKEPKQTPAANNSHVSVAALSPLSFRQSMKTILENRAMRLLVAVVFIQMGGAAWVAMMDYYLLVYFVHGGDIAAGAVWKGVLSTAYALAGMACVPVVVYFSRRMGKLNALKAIFILNAVGGVAKWFIFVPGVDWVIVLDAVLCSAIWTAMVVLVPSIVSDLNAQSRLSRSEMQSASSPSQAGAYVAVHGWAVSFAGMLAFLASGLTLNIIGFDAASGAQQTEGAIWNMRVILSGGTLLFSVCALAVLHYFGGYRQNTP